MRFTMRRAISLRRSARHRNGAVLGDKSDEKAAKKRYYRIAADSAMPAGGAIAAGGAV